MTQTVPNVPSSRDLEAAAVQAFKAEWSYWLSENLDPCAFDDDVAISILTEKGIPACRLAVDVQALVGQAYWQAKQSA